jgi:general secretion pathway protein D
VLVEASIVEVTLGKLDSMGIDLQGTIATSNGVLFGQNNVGSFTDFFSNPAAVQNLTVAAASEGTIKLPGGFVLPSQAILINALSQNSSVRVLSSPSIVTSDNDEAEIIVGENVPFITSTSTDPSNLGNTFNQVQREDVGIKLRIVPQITTGDLITLEMFVEISSVVPGTRDASNGPTTAIRTTETTIVVKDRQMSVTSGLISDNVTESENGIPLLKEIPVLGALFRSRKESVNRTNLLIFITPRIIRDEVEAKVVSSTLQKRVEERNGNEEMERLRNRTAALIGEGEYE